MKKRITALLLVYVLIFSLAPGIALTAQANTNFTPVTGWDMMERLGLGISFANTTEARAWPWFPGWYDFSENAWGQPLIEEWHLQSVALKGFDSYRMCVTWTTRFATAPTAVPPEYILPDTGYICPTFDIHAMVVEWATNADFTLNPAFLDRIQQIADWALDAGLYVIINTHHEEELYWLIQHDEFELAEKLLNAIWSQVSERFADYSERIIFEIMNEPHLLRHYQGPGHWVTRGCPYCAGRHVCGRLSNMVNKLNASALDVIRSSGGNNAQRVVMLGIPGATARGIPFLEIPNCPYIITGAFGYYGWMFMDNEIMGIIQNQLLNNQIGFVNKEDSSVGDGLGGPGYGGDSVARVTHHFGRFAQMGIPSFFFSGCASNALQGDEGSLLNRVTGEWHNLHILNALFAAYGKTPGPDLPKPPPPPPQLPFELAGPFTNGGFTFWNPPIRELNAAERMVVEHTGITGSLIFMRDGDGMPWTEWRSWVEGEQDRITQEPGRIIFDMRGLTGGNRVGFIPWDVQDISSELITRVFLDVFPPGPNEYFWDWATDMLYINGEPTPLTGSVQMQIGPYYARWEFENGSLVGPFTGTHDGAIFVQGGEMTGAIAALEAIGAYNDPARGAWFAWALGEGWALWFFCLELNAPVGGGFHTLPNFWYNHTHLFPPGHDYYPSWTDDRPILVFFFDDDGNLDLSVYPTVP